MVSSSSRTRDWLDGSARAPQLDSPRLLQQVIRPLVAVSVGDDCWPGPVADKLGNLCVGKAALTRLRDKGCQRHTPQQDERADQCLIVAAVSASNTNNMYGDWVTYFAAKRVVRKLYLPGYLPAFLENERRQLTVPVIAPRDLAVVTETVGGEWVPIGQRLVPKRRGFLGTKLNMGFLSFDWELAAYRRAESSP